MLIVGYLVNLMVMFNEVEMAIWSFLMASLHAVSKFWWLIVDLMVNLIVFFLWSWNDYSIFFDVKSTRGVQIMMVNSGLPGEFNGAFLMKLKWLSEVSWWQAYTWCPHYDG